MILRSDRKFASDTAWNLVSLAIQLGCGAGLVLYLIHQAGPAGLGVFNQLYVLFAISGQLFVLGLNDSAQMHTARHSGSPEEQARLARGALLCALSCGAGGSLLIGVASPGIGWASGSSFVTRGTLYLAPGVLCFVLNKVLLSLCNGEQRMRTYALGNAARAALVTGGCVLVVRAQADLSWFGLVFTASELVLLLALLGDRLPRLAAGAGGGPSWVARHLRFGLPLVPHSLLAEGFLRIDVLLIAFFLDDAAVGTYSFAAFFVEGLLQLGVVARQATNPMLVGLLLERRGAELRRVAARAMAASLVATALGGTLVWNLFPLFSPLFPLVDGAVCHRLLSILLLGLTAYALVLPIDHLLIQGGRPGAQSLYMLLISGINLTLNAILIPRQGLIGAAIATAVAFAAAGPVLGLLAWCSLPRPSAQAPDV